MPTHEIKKTNHPSSTTTMLAASVTGLAEAGLFHGVDTAAKRLMNNSSKIPTHLLWKGKFAELRNAVWPVIFKSAYNQNITAKITSLYPGLKYTALYKITERGTGIGGQQFFSQYLEKQFGAVYRNQFGNKQGKVLIEGTAGIMVGISQAFTILPFDALRTKAQTNLELVAGKSIGQLFKNEGFKLYNGAINVAARNAISSFVLFGVPSIVFQYGYNLKDDQKPNFTQRLSAYTTSAITTAFVTNPFDVIKTRVQAKPDAKTSTVFLQTIREEGLQAFRKGLVPKLSTAVPKIAFTMTMTPYVAEYVSVLETNVNHFFFRTSKKSTTQGTESKPTFKA